MIADSAENSVETLAVIDFETTGMGPQQGARATEIAAVLLRGGQVVGHYQSLMRSDVRVPPFIERLTGISNAMLAQAPPAEQVMREVLDFVGDCPLVAHNAAFDRGFWLAEAARAGRPLGEGPGFACTLLLSRRLFDQAPSHRLSDLAGWLGLARDGRAHRALSDATLTAHLLARLQDEVARRFEDRLDGMPVGHATLCRLQRAPRQRLDQALGVPAAVSVGKLSRRAG
ncbi:3'-5' exonuclease [Ideonella dechloratans]|uniref:3'-5' exonuclease n=1 Tax=Ideonella dechloratans TaxID=36863 RepID=A0A643F7H8_IDEDE|nr:3'-5' exonuclease [Ideonella dechloratans]KAB0575096.1 3'-5' exonuclease [Ideonella dechloratans]UFU11993.1 3'-5' exonuclease [Ideonella dechloratans]